MMRSPAFRRWQATTPDRPPKPNEFSSYLRDYEYKRLGTVSLLAGLDLHTGRVIELVRDHHASADLIALLGKLDESYPAHVRIRLLLDNHSAHISKETQNWLNLHPHIDRSHSSVLRGDLRGPYHLSLEVQNGRNRYWLNI